MEMVTRAFNSVFKMVTELSSNWLKIQATLKQSTSAPPDRKDVNTLTDRMKNTSAKHQRLKERRQNFSTNHSKNKRNTIPDNLSAKHDVTVEGNLAIPSAMASVPASTLSSFWDIPSSNILEAYGGGFLQNSKTIIADVVNGGLQDGVDIGKYVGIDCEMVGVGGKFEVSVLARISLVNFHGLQIYDSYVKPTAFVTNWRTKVSGISAELMPVAREFGEVQRQVASIIKNRILVGHSLNHDLSALRLHHPKKDIRDTSTFTGFRKYTRGRTPGLRQLAKCILGLDIQSGAHSSIEDARVTMLLFKRHKAEFDAEHVKRYPESKPSTKPTAKKPKQMPKSKSKKRKG